MSSSWWQNPRDNAVPNDGNLPGEYAMSRVKTVNNEPRCIPSDARSLQPPAVANIDDEIEFGNSMRLETDGLPYGPAVRRPAVVLRESDFPRLIRFYQGISASVNQFGHSDV